ARARRPLRWPALSLTRIIVFRHLNEQRDDKNQAVDPIEHAAVTGNASSPILRSEFSFDHTQRQIAERTADAHDQSGHHQLPDPEEWKREVQQPGQSERDRERAERPFPGLAWTNLAPQRMPPEHFAKHESG